MFVKPAKGLQIVDLELRDYLPAGGRTVTPSEYWTRRVNDGDVTLGKPAPPQKPKAAVAAPPSTSPPLPAAAQPQE